VRRAFHLARIALAAEGLRWRVLARARLRQAALAFVALIFLLFALALGHAAAFFRLAPSFGVIGAALTLASVDLALALVLLFFAARGSTRLAAEAEALRRAALAELRAESPQAALHALLRLWRETRRR
jgi:protein-S-isoprenylcysteine O-methyltransferase Ste14